MGLFIYKTIFTSRNWFDILNLRVGGDVSVDETQKIKNRLGTIYICLAVLIAFLALTSGGIGIIEIINIALVVILFILLQTQTLKLMPLCIASIVVGLIILLTCKGISIIMAIWLIIYSIIALTKIKKIGA